MMAITAAKGGPHMAVEVPTDAMMFTIEDLRRELGG
jgi:hypothetical protein